MSSNNNNLVWFVEDDWNDVLLIQRALRLSALPIAAKFATTVDELQALFCAVETDGVLPKVIVTDLKLTGDDGFSVMQLIRTQHSLKSIPLVVLTSSTLEDDRNRAQQLGAIAYIIKSTGSALATSLRETIGPLLDPS